MVNTPAQAVARAKLMVARGELFPGLCLKAVRTDLGVPSKYGSAIEAWRNTPSAHRHKGPTPAGYPIFYDIGPYGHVVLSDVDGFVYSNMSGDRHHPGIVQRVKRGYFGGDLGWATQLNDRDLTPPTYGPPRYDGPYYPGAVDPAIREVRRHLLLPAGNVYDPATVAAVKRYKNRHPYLILDGGRAAYIGPRTYASILKQPLHQG